MKSHYLGMLFVTGLLAMACQLSTPPVTSSPTASTLPASPSAVSSPTLQVTPHSSDIAQEFINASYRVLAVAKNPFAPYFLIVATERSKEMCGDSLNPSRCMNDTSCGSIYTSPNCYFFIEPDFVYGANPETRLIAQWWDEQDHLAGLVLDTIRFTSASGVEFSTAGGDGNFSVRSVWQLDLDTGRITLINREAQTGESP
jgi:hypothetical protein